MKTTSTHKHARPTPDSKDNEKQNELSDQKSNKNSRAQFWIIVHPVGAQSTYYKRCRLSRLPIKR